jgi:uncharacterized protein YbaR (Trm112 family)
MKAILCLFALWLRWLRWLISAIRNPLNMAGQSNMNLRRPICRGILFSSQSPEVTLGCQSCDETFPVVNGIPRMISSAMRQAIGGNPPADLTQTDRLRAETVRPNYGWRQTGRKPVES